MTDTFSPEYQLNRIWRMRDLRDTVDGEYRLAIAMARHIGVPIETVAKRAGIAVSEVDRVAEELSGEDIVELSETELDWVERHHGSVSFR